MCTTHLNKLNKLCIIPSLVPFCHPPPHSVQKPHTQSFSLASPLQRIQIIKISLPTEDTFSLRRVFDSSLTSLQPKGQLSYPYGQLPFSKNLIPLFLNMKVIITFLTVFLFLPCFVLQHQGLANYSLRAKSCLPLLYVNRVSLEYKYIHYIECLIGKKIINIKLTKVKLKKNNNYFSLELMGLRLKISSLCIQHCQRDNWEHYRQHTP